MKLLLDSGVAGGGGRPPDPVWDEEGGGGVEVIEESGDCVPNRAPSLRIVLGINQKGRNS